MSALDVFVSDNYVSLANPVYCNILVLVLGRFPLSRAFIAYVEGIFML